jgi:hypothetical protein
MRVLLVAILFSLSACEAPSSSPPPPTSPTEVDMPQCRAICDDRRSRCRDTPDHPCQTVEDCMSVCREPDPT